jgi:hypothetical protein
LLAIGARPGAGGELRPFSPILLSIDHFLTPVNRKNGFQEEDESDNNK